MILHYTTYYTTVLLLFVKRVPEKKHQFFSPENPNHLRLKVTTKSGEIVPLDLFLLFAYINITYIYIRFRSALLLLVHSIHCLLLSKCGLVVFCCREQIFHRFILMWNFSPPFLAKAHSF